MAIYQLGLSVKKTGLQQLQPDNSSLYEYEYIRTYLNTETGETYTERETQWHDEATANTTPEGDFYSYGVNVVIHEECIPNTTTKKKFISDGGLGYFINEETNSIDCGYIPPVDDLVLNATSVNPSVVNGLGSITATVTSGTNPPFKVRVVELNNGAWVIGSTSTWNAPVGTYTVEAIDSANFKRNATIVLVQPTNDIDGTVSSTNITTIGANNGTITVTMTSSGTPFEYSYKLTTASVWINKGGTSVIGGLAAGNYDVLVKDVKGYTKVFSGITISEPKCTLKLKGEVLKHETYVGSGDGVIKALVTLNQGVVTYKLEKNNVSFIDYTTNNTFLNLSEGIYKVYAKDDICEVVSGVLTISALQEIEPIGDDQEIIVNEDLKFSKQSDSSKYFRIKMEPGNPSEKYVTVEFKQSFNFLQFLSLKLSDTDIYRLFNANYGVIAGRVIANDGVGLPNCRISIFVPVEEANYTTHIEMLKGDVVRALYPYEKVTDENNLGVRYNLLPAQSTYQGYNGFPVNPYGIGATPQVPVGSFGDKEEVVTNPIYLEVYEKYYKYTTVTNDSGDYMLFGVPAGNHTLHMDCDLTDIGRWSMSPSIMSQVLGYPEGLFTKNGSAIKKTKNLDALPQIRTQDIPITVKPLWSQLEDKTEIGITRQDFLLNGEIMPFVTVFGAGFTMGIDSYIGDRYGDFERESAICGGLYNRKEFIQAGKTFWDFIFGAPLTTESGVIEEQRLKTYQPAQPEYIMLFNNWVKNNTPVANIVNHIKVPFKDLILSNAGMSPDFATKSGVTINTGLVDYINAKRKYGTSPTSIPLEDAFNIQMRDANGNQVYSNQFINTHFYFTKTEALDLFYYQQILGGQIMEPEAVDITYPSGNRQTEHVGESYNVKGWTTKLNYETFRDHLFKVNVFSYKENISNGQITNGDSKIKIESDITKLLDNQYAIHREIGVFGMHIPCDRTRIITNEEGLLVPSPDPSKGVYSEFGGYMIFEMEGTIIPIELDMNVTPRLDRVKIRVPQDSSAYVGTVVNDDYAQRKYNETWARKGVVFKAGEFYSVSERIGGIENSTSQLDRRVTMIMKPNELRTESDIDNGTKLIGFPGNTTYVRQHNVENQISVTQEVTIQGFQNEWLNFSLYFPQYRYKIRSLDGKYFGSEYIISCRHHQVVDNEDPLGGVVRNSKSMLNGDIFPTAFIRVDKRDFIHFFGKEDHGFTSRYLPISTENKNNYKSVLTTKYFYCGRTNNVFKFLKEYNMI